MIANNPGAYVGRVLEAEAVADRGIVVANTTNSAAQAATNASLTASNAATNATNAAKAASDAATVATAAAQAGGQ